jgi:hypothetical protein
VKGDSDVPETWTKVKIEEIAEIADLTATYPQYHKIVP